MEPNFLSPLLSVQVPPLPDSPLMWAARHVSWASVLVFLALAAGQRWPRVLRWGLAAVLLLWALLPGAWSLAYWLGLAFQMPSLSSTLVCLVGTWRIVRTGNWRLPDARQRMVLGRLGLVGIALGWVLLLDTFALWPVSIYALGFSPLLLLVVALLAALPWMWLGARHPASVVSWLAGPSLLLYVLLHLPNGNLWNALIDPWLWIALQVGLLARLVKRFRGGQRG